MSLIWKLIARVVTIPAVTDWLIRRAMRTPYRPIMSPDGNSLYMARYWLFNAYPDPYNGASHGRHIPWLPSVRIHHICRPDQDRDLHDHPWNARTIVLRGWYIEERRWVDLTDKEAMAADGAAAGDPFRATFVRRRSYTGRLLYGQYHRISEVSPNGVWTLFITGKQRGTWGFLVNGQKVPWRTYLGLDKHEEGAA